MEAVCIAQLNEIIKNDTELCENTKQIKNKMADNFDLKKFLKESKAIENLNNVFKKETLKSMYWIDGHVHTPFGRKIEADEHHAIPYLNQSTFIDLFHRQVIKVDDFLKNKKSFVSFLLHDEFVIDMKDEEKTDILEIAKIVQTTQFGKFLCNIKVGRDYGNMKKLNLKVD